MSLSARLRPLDPLLLALIAAAESTGRATRRYLGEHRRGRSATLRPGPDTPLWNELVTACRKHLRRRGDKALLARFLGIPRQRLHSLLVAKTACADAERTLLLLIWLSQKNSGVQPG